MLRVCPHCQRPFPPEVDLGGTVRQRLYDYVAKHPEGVTHAQVMDHVYADDPNGGPVSSSVIAVHVRKINDWLERHGYHHRIKGSPRGGPGARYKLLLNGEEYK